MVHRPRWTLQNGEGPLPDVFSEDFAAFLARRVEEEGADVIVASGTEAGGHCSFVATLPLVPQVVDAVKVPVVACGGIGDSRVFLAALALGACGIQMGTRFLASTECICHPKFKEKIRLSKEEDTVVFQG